MKKIAKFLTALLGAILILTVASFAQDSTVVTTPADSGSVIDWIKNNYIAFLGALLAVYEIIVRLFPTVKNISVISGIVKLINTILPNKAAPGATAKTITTSPDSTPKFTS